MSETVISKSIRDALSAAGIWCERVNAGKVPTRGGFYQGAKAGTPDTIIVAPASVAGSWLETKTPIGKLSDKQKDWHRKAAKLGVRVAVVRSAKEALETVRIWMADRRSAA